MTMNLIPGYLTEVTVNLVEIGVYGNVVGLDLTKNAPRKPLFGQQAQRAISGQTAGSFSAGGHVAAEGPIAPLFAAMAAVTPVAFLIQVGAAGGDTDGGTISGNCIVTGVTLNADAEGEWEWSMSADIDGAATHTPPA